MATVSDMLCFSHSPAVNECRVRASYRVCDVGIYRDMILQLFCSLYKINKKFFLNKNIKITPENFIRIHYYEFKIEKKIYIRSINVNKYDFFRKCLKNT